MKKSSAFFKDPVSLQFLGFLDTAELFIEKDDLGFPPFLLKKTQASKAFLPGPIVPEKVILGKRMELFFKYYIDHFSEESVLENNVQIKSGKITIGELDFILENPSFQKIFHVEFVYKFYLYEPEIEKEKERWIGPNHNDSLVKKMERLKKQQFPLLYRKETMEMLEKLGVRPKDIEQRLCFKANLFVPRGLLGKKFPMVNNSCIQGFWLKASDFTASSFPFAKFHLPKKADWSINPKFGQQWLSFNEIQEELHFLLAKQKSPLIWMKNDRDIFQRFFVVCW